MNIVRFVKEREYIIGRRCYLLFELAGLSIVIDVSVSISNNGFFTTKNHPRVVFDNCNFFVQNVSVRMVWLLFMLLAGTQWLVPSIKL